MLSKYLKKHLSSVVAATVCSVLLGLVSTILFSLIGPALQLILSPELQTIELVNLFGENLGGMIVGILGFGAVSARDLWSQLPYLIIGLGALRAFFIALGWFLWERASEKIAAGIRSALVESYLHLDPHATYAAEGFDKRLSSILTTDVKLTREYIVHFYGGLPRELLQSIFYFASLYLLSPQLFAIFILGLLPAGLLISKLGKKIRRRSAAALDNFGSLSEWLQQRLIGIETIKQLNTERLEASTLGKLTTELNKRFLRTIRVKIRTAPLLEVIAVSAMVVILFIALDMVAKGDTTGAILMSFFSLLGILSQSISKLGRYFNSNKEGGAALSRIVDLKSFMDQHHTVEIPIQFHDGDEVLKLESVSLKYPGQDLQALDNVTYSFEKGKIYCLAGESGAGKSSLFSVLLGLVEPTEGRLLFNRKLNRRNIGYLPQSMFLAPATLAENIVYPDQGVESEKMREALTQASALGLEAKVMGNLEEQGLSGGQLQRLFLARLFYKNYSVVLIDEGTSAIDPENEAAIYQSIQSLADNGTTVIMIAHRQSGIDAADKVLRLENGRLEG